MSMSRHDASTGEQSRMLSRENKVTITSGLSPSYLQANLIILPSRYASDFRRFCQRNPVPSPLLAESSQRGSPVGWKSYIQGIPDSAVAANCDIRTDVPRYVVYRDGVPIHESQDLLEEWTDDHIAFLLGCSMSFESALTRAGLEPRHTTLDINNPMYITNIPTNPAGVFTGGTYIVSMRPYRRSELDRVRETTRPYVLTHGEPIAWGWDGMARLGITDIDQPNWGDPPRARWGGKFGEAQGLTGEDDDIPVFWGCGVTPQQAVITAKVPGIILAHAPGHMLVLDVKEDDVLEKD